MSEDTELLTGREGIEASQGNSPMPSATPAETGGDAPLDEHLVEHFNRPAEADFGQLEERAYFDADGSGRRRDETETVEADRAAEDLTAIRKAERDARERELDEATAAAVDSLRQQVQDPTGQTPSDTNDAARARMAEQAQQRDDLALQPEQIDPAQAEAVVAEADREIARFLENPAVRQRVEQEFAAVNQAASAHVEQAKAAYTAAVTQNALVGLAVLNSAFPELAGLNPEQVNGALRVMRPERAEQYRQHVRQVSALAEGYQRQEAALQQQRAHEQLQQHARHWQGLQQYKDAEDKKIDAIIPLDDPIRKDVFGLTERHYGISRADWQELANNPHTARIVYSAKFQKILYDGLKAQEAKQSLAAHRNNPVPQVARPGVAAEREPDAGEISAAMARFNRPGGNVGRDGLRNAAAVVTARRARS
jgi:hypothetical protein